MARTNRYPDNPRPPNSIDAALHNLSVAWQPLRAALWEAHGQFLVIVAVVWVVLATTVVAIELL